MTAFWIAAACVLALSALWLAAPFLRRTEVERDETDSALSIYRDQADEVRRDLEMGLISEAEFDAAHQEIEARALRAARTSVRGMSVSRRAPILAAAIAAFLATGTFGGYLAIGAPGVPDHPLAARKSEQLIQKAQAGDLNSRIALLIEATKENPDSFDDWWMLARSYAAVGDHASAADAYRRAVELSDNRPAVLSAYGEAMTLANGNKVPQAARLLFQQVVRDTNDPRARYYLALARAQAQDFEGALHAWAALAAESEANAPWMPLVRRDIINMVRFTKGDLRDYLPNATEQEIARANGAPAASDARDALTARVKTLESQVAKDQTDYKAWLELAQIQAKLGETDKAGAAIAAARSQFAAAPFILSKIDDTAAQLGLDLVASSSEGVRGPTDEDIVAAQSMTAEEQAKMIDGMVAGLAAKLEENPDNPGGWTMLVRSYLQLGKTDKAKAALNTARAHFADNAAVLARLEQDAGSLITE